MSNYSVLKAAVQAVVKTNGNQEITGANMQSTLLSIIESLGADYQFAGIATTSTSPGTPDQNMFYIAPAGTYTNFGSSITIPVGSVGIFKYNGSWMQQTVYVTGDMYGSNAGIVKVAPYSHVNSSTNARWCLDWNPVVPGEILEVYQCNEGYVYFVIASSNGSSWDVNLTEEYQSVPFSYLFDNSIKKVRVLVAHSDMETQITSAQVNENFSYGMTSGSVMDRVEENRNFTKGNASSQVKIDPTNSSNSSSTTRWLLEWIGNVNNGDILEVSVKSGYIFSVFGKAPTGGAGASWVVAYQNSQYTNAPFKLSCNLGNSSCLRIIISHTDQTVDITEAQVEANVTYSLTRSMSLETVANNIFNLDNRKSINILFIGNSLTQDAVSYAPMLLQSIAPELKFNIHIYYNGGYTLSQQLTQMNNSGNCDIFSICESNMFWWNRRNSVSMADVLSHFSYDIICLQEYFNYMTTYTDADKAAYDGVLTYLKNHHSGAFKVATLLHPPKRDDIETIYQRTLDGVDWIMNNTPTESVIPAGVATYMAFSTSLDSLGDQGHLSNDGTHSQEGLPCMLEAYVTALWILRQVALPCGILGSTDRVTSANYPLIEVPGPNLGTGVVEGTEAEYWLAQKIATMAFNKYIR